MVEMLQHRSTSLVPLNNLGRNTFATIGSATAQPVMSAIGDVWTMTVMYFLSLVSIVCVFLIRRYGRCWRETLKVREKRWETKWSNQETFTLDHSKLHNYPKGSRQAT